MSAADPGQRSVAAIKRIDKCWRDSGDLAKSPTVRVGIKHTREDYQVS